MQSAYDYQAFNGTVDINGASHTFRQKCTYLDVYFDGSVHISFMVTEGVYGEEFRFFTSATLNNRVPIPLSCYGVRIRAHFGTVVYNIKGYFT